MVALLILLMFCSQLVQGSDWTGASWERILDVEDGAYYSSIRGLNCSGDTIYFMIGIDREPDGIVDEYECQKWYPYGMDQIAIPEAVTTGFRDMNYDSVNRVHPAFLTTLGLYRQNGGGWDSLNVSGINGGEDPQCFCYDSTGSLHYVTLHVSGNLFYHRRGGGRGARDEIFHPEFIWGWANQNATRICVPTARSVVICGAELATGFGLDLHDVYIRISTGDAPFSSQEVLVDRRFAPQLITGSDQQWIYALHRGFSAEQRMLVIRGNNAQVFSEEFPADVMTGNFSLSYNAQDHTFETAMVVDSTGETTFRVAEFVQSSWQQRLEITRNAPIVGFHLMVDGSGIGHLFVLDSLHLWYFGPRAVSEVDKPLVALPNDFSLTVYPNPFNLTAKIGFVLEHDAEVKLAIYDIVGRRVAVLNDGRAGMGEHTMEWNADQAASGIYFAVLHTGSEVRVGKMMLLK